MKKLSLIFLILFAFSLTAFAQTQQESKALLVNEFGKLSNGGYRSAFDNFFVDLMDNPTSQGIVVNYGSKTDIAGREKLIKNHIRFRNFDPSRINFINGGHSNEIKTQFWRVPEGAENPEPEPTAFIFDEFGTVTNGVIKLQMDKFFVELKNKPTFKGYIINYGQKKTVAARERMLKNYTRFRDFDTSRITFVNGGNTGKLKTVLWLIPEGVEPPKS